ncbi:hypothetical protein ABZ949_01965 [Micromonospora tulbaghiae]|uniref:hypothetical protein n=1 Tax=Micromonospora tulbaghiae TaxID=479978 RepID=UPI0033CE7055
MTRFSADDPASVQQVPDSQRWLLDYCKHCPMPGRLDLYTPQSVKAEPQRLLASYRCDEGHDWERGYAPLIGRVADVIRRTLTRSHGGHLSGAALRRAVAGRDRSHFGAALGALTACGEVEEEPVTYHGQVGSRYRLRSEADRIVSALGLHPATTGQGLVPLYFWFDADRLLLYVGITGDLATRQASHAKKSSWAEFATHCEVRRFPSRAEAERAEKAAIEAERPLFNHVHNDTAEARQRLVAYLIEHGRMDLLAPAVSRG